MNLSSKPDRYYKLSASEPDWEREKLTTWWQPSKQLIKSIRQYQKWQNRGVFGRIIQKYTVLEHRFWSVVTGSDIAITCRIEGGLALPHPNGIVISPSDTIIGPNCSILHQVTIVGGVTLGGNVQIGAGAKIIRPVTIGDHARIGANAVVVCDIPSEATVAGIPAKIIRETLPPSSEQEV
jgi:serine O-acetyltransferase